MPDVVARFQINFDAARALRNRAGNVAIISAIVAPLLLFIAAVAFDFSAQRNEDRQTQNAVDLAAIAAVSRIDQAEEIAYRTLQDNGVDFGGQSSADAIVSFEDLRAALSKANVEKGRFVRDVTIPIADRFASGVEPYNAVRVTVRKPSQQYFTKNLFGEMYLRRTAVAYATGDAAFSIGSRLASLNGGVLNTLLGEFLGGQISLSVMDYEALVDADVALFDFLDALAIETDVNAGTYNELLDSEVGIGEFFRALANVSRGDPTAGGAANQLATSLAGSNAKIPLSGVFNLGHAGEAKLGGHSATDVVVGIYDLIAASAVVADGEKQVTLNLDSSLAGLGSLKLRVTVGEPMQSMPWYRLGQKGDVVHTAQTRVAFDLTVGGTGLLAGAQVKLPIYIEAAYADGELTAVKCSGLINSRLNGIDVAVEPGIVEAWIGDLDGGAERNFDRTLEFRKATLVKTAALTVRGRSHVEMGNQSPTIISFSAREIASHVVKSTNTRNFTRSLLASLLGELELEVGAGGLALATPALVAPALETSLAPVSATVDDVILNVLSVLGIKLGEADIRADGGTCSRPVLVE